MDTCQAKFRAPRADSVLLEQAPREKQMLRVHFDSKRSWPRTGVLMALAIANWAVEAAQLDIAGPAGSAKFGTGVTLLPNGNIVTDPFFGPAEAL